MDGQVRKIPPPDSVFPYLILGYALPIEVMPFYRALYRQITRGNHIPSTQETGQEPVGRPSPDPHQDRQFFLNVVSSSSAIRSRSISPDRMALARFRIYRSFCLEN